MQLFVIAMHRRDPPEGCGQSNKDQWRAYVSPFISNPTRLDLSKIKMQTHLCLFSDMSHVEVCIEDVRLLENPFSIPLDHSRE